MAYQLSLDTCTKACSVALTSLDGEKAASWFEILDRGHAEILAVQVENLMQKLSIEAKDIEQIAVTIGPGTFTGARIALAFARMFATARNIPIVAVNSLEAIGFNGVEKLSLNKDVIIHTAIDARRGQVYFASFNHLGDEIFAPEAIDIDAAARMLNAEDVILGTGRELLISANAEFIDIHKIDDDLHFPNAATFGKKVMNRAVEIMPVSPLYLRAADAKLPASHPITFTK